MYNHCYFIIKIILAQTLEELYNKLNQMTLQDVSVLLQKTLTFQQLEMSLEKVQAGIEGIFYYFLFYNLIIFKVFIKMDSNEDVSQIIDNMKNHFIDHLQICERRITVELHNSKKRVSNDYLIRITDDNGNNNNNNNNSSLSSIPFWVWIVIALSVLIVIILIIAIIIVAKRKTNQELERF